MKKLKFPIIKYFLYLLFIVPLIYHPAQATTYVLLDYDGDASFPSLTWQYNTTGLNAFTGSAFRTGGFSATDMTAVKTNIGNYLAADYAPYDISFVTDTSGLSSWYTAGIDDTAYTFSWDGDDPAGSLDGTFYSDPLYPNPMNPNAPCPESYPNGCSRLFGKSANNPGDTDQDGNNIYNPTYSRLWAGSFALGAGSASPSLPSLFGAGLDDISQALGNLFAHEIAHLFGVGHPWEGSSTATWNAHHGWDLMYTEVESVESTQNKHFSSGDQAILMSALGDIDDNTCEFGGTWPECNSDPGNGGHITVPEPATVALMGLGLAGIGFTRRRVKN